MTIAWGPNFVSMSHVEEGNAADGLPHAETSIEFVADVIEGGMSGR